MSLKNQADLYSSMGQIGMDLPEVVEIIPEGPNLDIKLRPKYPKNPDKSKKCYKGFFLRPLGKFVHIYDIEENLYIVSLQRYKDVEEWIDKNYERIRRKINEFKSNIKSN